MNLTQAIKMAAKSISSNKGRSVLTMLGIIIGLAAVIILVSYAQGQNMAMKAYYESMGSNKINVSAYTWGNSSSVDVGRRSTTTASSSTAWWAFPPTDISGPAPPSSMSPKPSAGTPIDPMAAEV